MKLRLSSCNAKWLCQFTLQLTCLRDWKDSKETQFLIHPPQPWKFLWVPWAIYSPSLQPSSPYRAVLGGGGIWSTQYTALSSWMKRRVRSNQKGFHKPSNAWIFHTELHSLIPNAQASKETFHQLTSLSPFFLRVWTESDSTSLSNWSTCIFKVSIVFWEEGREERGSRQTDHYSVRQWNRQIYLSSYAGKRN